MCPQVEFGGDTVGGGGAHGAIKGGVAGEGTEGLCEGPGIALGREKSADAVLDGFGNTAVAGGHDGQAAGHGFKHGVGHAFLIAVGAEFAGVEEKVRAGVKGAQLFLREKAGKGDVFSETEGFGERAEAGQLRAIAGDGESGARKFGDEIRERAQAGD